ncbi:phenylalanine--tRNA ligase subunit beta [Candidatus Parcubacteria bacterium]|nr:phenylalanine--tRNA ligase subunit beta [Candidatus Parcubacteria bacterium]
MSSFEIEKLEKKGDDWVLDIDVLPNRAGDCFSHLGIARECAALLNLKLKTQNTKFQPKTQNLDIKNLLKIKVENSDLCSRYTARVMIDVKIGESPEWMRERLKVCGLQPINNVVDIANYVMLELGQPLHAFDLHKISGKKIIVRKAKKGEKIITLDNNKFNLAQDILIIADEKNPLAIAGIKGGKKAEIDKNTKTIVLEAANFDKIIIRKTRQELKLQTDASLRFEHGIDANLTEQGINRAADLIQKICNGKTSKGLIDFFPKKVFPKTIKLELDYIEQLLGVKIPKKEIISIFQKLGFTPIDQSIGVKKMLLVKIPTFRLDISIPEDLIEEIGRIYGYDHIKPIFPLAVLTPPKRNIDCFWQKKVKNILKETGFTEVYNYSFINEKDAKIFNWQQKTLIELENPLSAEQKYLRPCLIPNLLKNIQKNQKRFNEIKIFELGKVFRTGLKTGVEEKRMLTGILTGNNMFYQTKGVVDLLLNKLGISNVWYNEQEMFICKTKKCAEIKINGKGIGFLGEISAEIKACVFAIDFEKLQKHCSEEVMYQPISLYPTAIRDLAVLVPREIKVADVLNKINIAGGKLVRDVDIFDIYEGEKIQDGKKNFAFHIIYQAEDRTLTNKEIDEIHNRIIKVLEKNPSWEVRK